MKLYEVMVVLYVKHEPPHVIRERTFGDEGLARAQFNVYKQDLPRAFHVNFDNGGERLPEKMPSELMVVSFSTYEACEEVKPIPVLEARSWDWIYRW